MPQTRATQAHSTSWSLEVVRGHDVGKVFDLRGDEILLGNGLDGAVGLDLRDQEAGSPRRMAARQAVLESRGGDLVIRDLDSSGGTFVNRQRLLSGQPRRLQADDEIQLGGVLLRVAASRPTAVVPQAVPPPLVATPRPSATSASSIPGRLADPYTIAGAVACRTWDDFLVVAAQRWTDLRDDLVSGRLADYLRRIRRTDLLPPAAASGSADEQLDQWLGRLPVSRSSAPELDVHPDKLEVRPSGGTTREVLRITNVGYRLLRSTVRVEPAGAGWVRIARPFDGVPFPTIEETEIPVELDLPDSSAADLAAEIVIESNGGARRIGVRIGAAARPADLPEAVAFRPGPTTSDLLGPISRKLAGVRLPVRIAAGIVAALTARTLVLLSGILPLGPRGLSIAEPRLPAMAVACVGLGVVAGLLIGWRRSRSPSDAATTGVAAGLAAVLVAAVIYAIVRTVEGALGDWSSSLWALGLVWSAIGAATAGLSGLLLPFREPSGETPR